MGIISYMLSKAESATLLPQTERSYIQMRQILQQDALNLLQFCKQTL
jgi:hypothetical protein